MKIATQNFATFTSGVVFFLAIAIGIFPDNPSNFYSFEVAIPIALILTATTYIFLDANRIYQQEWKTCANAKRAPSYKAALAKPFKSYSFMIEGGFAGLLFSCGWSWSSVFLITIAFFPLITSLIQAFFPPAIDRNEQAENHLRSITEDLMEWRQHLGCQILIAQEPLFEKNKDDIEDPPEPTIHVFGYGQSKQIVIPFEFLSTYSDVGLRGLVAHEFAHIQLRHKAISSAVTTLPLALLVTSSEYYLNLPTASLWGAAFLVILLQLWVLRFRDYAADRLAVQWVGKEAVAEGINEPNQKITYSLMDRLFFHWPTPGNRLKQLSSKSS
jgi:Zn-dependent protease with chaperone function